MCRSWPGVVIPSSHKPSSTVDDATSTTTTGINKTLVIIAISILKRIILLLEMLKWSNIVKCSHSC